MEAKNTSAAWIDVAIWLVEPVMDDPFEISVRESRTLGYQQIRRGSFTCNDANKLFNYTTATA